MRLRVIAALATAILFLAPSPGRADLTSYLQSFESLPMGDVTALANDGWLVFGIVYRDLPVPPVDTTYVYQYGPYPAPNDGAAFCAIDTLQGAGAFNSKQLSVYSDYNNTAHASPGYVVESIVYREWTVGAGDVGSNWIFYFEHKRGNLLNPGATAMAFIKTLTPAPEYQLTNFLKADMTFTLTTWGRDSLTIAITPDLVGQIFQIGFSNMASGYQPSGMFYDNVILHDRTVSAVEVPGGPEARRPTASVAPNPLNPAGTLSFRTVGDGPVSVKMFDLNGRLVRTLLDRQALPAGPHTIPIDGRDATGTRLSSGVYFYRVDTADGAVRGKVSIVK